MIIPCLSLAVATDKRQGLAHTRYQKAPAGRGFLEGSLLILVGTDDD